MSYSSQRLDASPRSCFGALLLATLLVVTGCDSGGTVDPLPADPAANMVGDPMAGAAQAKMATRAVTGAAPLVGTITARRGNRARGPIRVTGTTDDETSFNLEGRARYFGVNTDGSGPLFERAQLRLVGTVGTVVLRDSLWVRLRYREDAEGTVYDVQGRFRSDEQKGRLRGTLTGSFSRVSPSTFLFDGKFDFQVALPLG